MAVGSQQYAVGSSTAVVLASAPPGPTGQVGAVLLYPDASLDVYLGGANVSATNGLKLKSAGTVPLNVPLFAGDTLYGLAASSTATVGVLRLGA